MGISVPLRRCNEEILLAIEREEELGTVELVQRMNKSPGNAINKILDRLEQGNWVSSRLVKVPGERNRPRRFYRLTEMGKEVLKLHLSYRELHPD